MAKKFSKRLSRRKASQKKSERRAITLYVKNAAVWNEAIDRATSFDDSLSTYVEHALRFFNKGGE